MQFDCEKNLTVGPREYKKQYWYMRSSVFFVNNQENTAR